MKSDVARWLILLCILVCASTVSSPASATTFDPLLAGPPRMIVLSLTIEGEDKHLIPLRELESELVDYMSSRLRDEGLDILVTASGNYKLPEGIFPRNVVTLFVRIDLASVDVRSQVTTVGATSILIRRESETSWASRPFTFFAAEAESEVAERARGAAKEQLDINIIRPIVFLTK